MTLATPPVGQPVNQTQIDAWINLCNSLLQSTSLACTANTTLTTTETAVPGCSMSVTTVGPSSFAIVSGVFDFAVTGASGGVTMVGRCQLNGVDQPSGNTAEAHLEDNGINTRATAAQTWKVPLGTVTGAVIRLTALTASSGGAHVVESEHTTMTVTVYDLM
jgi:hypothetical protein